MAKADYYKAKHSFGVTFEGEPIVVHKGEIVPAGHPLLKIAEHFEPVEDFGRFDKARPEKRKKPEVEQATAAPGEKRGEDKKK